MLFFIALSALAAATFGSVVLYQRGEKKRIEGADPRLLLPERKKKKESASETKKTPLERPKASVDPTLETLAAGDIVVDGNDDWLVTGTVSYREERETWSLYALEGGPSGFSGRRFLEVRKRDGGLDVAFVDPAKGLPSGQLMHGLTFAGHSFQLELRGDARVSVDGDVGSSVSAGGVIAYARYGGAGGALLLVEDEGAARRAFLGSRIPASSLSLMSGELNRSQR